MGKTYRKVPHSLQFDDDHEVYERGHVKFDVNHNTDGYVDLRKAKKIFKKKRKKKDRQQNKAA